MMDPAEWEQLSATWWDNPDALDVDDEFQQVRDAAIQWLEERAKRKFGVDIRVWPKRRYWRLIDGFLAIYERDWKSDFYASVHWVDEQIRRYTEGK